MTKMQNKVTHRMREREAQNRIGRRDYVSVASYLGLGGNRQWYPIPGYSGYELSGDGYIRSLKFVTKEPYGILIKPDKKGRYALMNSTTGDRDVLSMSKIRELVNSNPDKFKTARPTHVAYAAARNKSTFLRDPHPRPTKKKDIQRDAPGGMFTITNDSTSSNENFTGAQFMVTKEPVPFEENKPRGWCPIYRIK